MCGVNVLIVVAFMLASLSRGVFCSNPLYEMEGHFHSTIYKGSPIYWVSGVRPDFRSAPSHTVTVASIEKVSYTVTDRWTEGREHSQHHLSYQVLSGWTGTFAKREEVRPDKT